MPTMTQCTREDAIRYIRQGGFAHLGDALKRRGLSRETLIEIANELNLSQYTTPESIRSAIRSRTIEKMRMIDKLEGQPLYPHRTGR